MSNLQLLPEATTSGLRQRSCKRVSCQAELPKLDVGEERSGNCCDDSCLVELSRRECDSACLPNSNPVVTSYDSKPKDKKQPCETHLIKTRDQYGAILKSLGCICKVLLSLNIESCCVLPEHASLGSRRSGGSLKSAPRNGKGREKGGEGCGGDCCGDKKEVVIKEKDDEQCGGGCCGEKTLEGEDDCCAATSGGEDVVDDKSVDCDGVGCCGDSTELAQPLTTGKSIGGLDTRSKEGFCNETQKAETSSAGGCTKGCCARDDKSTTSTIGEHAEQASYHAKIETKLEPEAACVSGSGCCDTTLKSSLAIADTVVNIGTPCLGACCDSKVDKDVKDAKTLNASTSPKDDCCDGSLNEKGSLKGSLLEVEHCSQGDCCGGAKSLVTTKPSSTKSGRGTGYTNQRQENLSTISDDSKSKLDDCAKDDCCSLGTGPLPNQKSAALDDCIKKGCCGKSSKQDTTTGAPRDNGDSIIRSGAAHLAPPKTSCVKNCCTSKVMELLVSKAAEDLSDCSEKGCRTPKIIAAVGTRPEEKGCVEKSCCNQELPAVMVSDKGSRDDFAIDPVLPSSGFGTDRIDIEKGDFFVEHLILSVAGMTCTGCEKKLFRSLDSLPSISNIKTSLVLAQAEFDVSGASVIDTNSVIKTLEKMTGFTCSKMSQSGQEVDLVVNNVEHFDNMKLMPAGITDLVVLDKTTIRVTYNPDIIGARELLADPAFRFAKLAPQAERPLIASGRAHVRATLWMTILSVLLTIPVLVLAWAPLPEHEILYGAISLGLATAVQVLIAGPFYTAALKALIFSRMIEMDLLIVISTTTAYVYSIIAYGYVAAGKPLSTGEFFETSTLLVTLIMVGRTVSAFARQKAVESISIESLQTPTAILTDPVTHHEEEIDARLLQYKDIFKVLPDSSIVTDGVILSGESEVDESMITGESRLIHKSPGSAVVAGSLNHSGSLVVRLTRLPGENTIKAISCMVDEAKSSKPKIQQIADRVAGYFVPFILAITLIVFVIWIGVGKNVRHQDTATMFIVAMTYAISALIVSCPCAIGLAVPLVVVIAGGVAAKHGLIFKSAESIEIARKTTHVVFDKTGTLTQGKLSVETKEYPASTVEHLAPMLLGLTMNSKHPVSIAIAEHLKRLYISPSRVGNIKSIPGKGVEGMCKSHVLRAGNPYWMGVENEPAVRNALSRNLTLFCFTIDAILVAVYGLKDTIRPDALETISQLKVRGIEVSLVSGDSTEAVHSVAASLGIPSNNVRARFGPGDKKAYVQSPPTTPSSIKNYQTPLWLRNQKQRNSKQIVIFVGDGTNDAPALTQAHIGIHINTGTEIASSASDVTLISPSLLNILKLIDLSKAFHRRVVFNFVWAGVYNLFAILLAAGAFVAVREGGVRIEPKWAGLGEIVSVVPVVGVAVGLRWVRL